VEDRKRTNQPFNVEANKEMLEREAKEKRKREAKQKRADKAAGAQCALPSTPEKLCWRKSWSSRAVVNCNRPVSELQCEAINLLFATHGLPQIAKRWAPEE
jgi:hypothetical protein